MSANLVIGGTGKTGRRVVAELERRGTVAWAAARHNAPVRFDWADRSTYAPALRDVRAVYLVVPGAMGEYGEALQHLLRLAEQSVERVVLLSARATEFHRSGQLAAAEDLVMDSRMAWTVLRPSWFAQNFTEGFFRPTPDGTIAAPTGRGPEPFIDVMDVADVAAEVLTGDGHAGRVYDLSGPRALPFAEAVDVLGRAMGRALHFTALEPEAYRRELAASLPESYVEWRMAMLDAIREGHDAYVSGGVAEVLGREPTSFESWAAREAAGVVARA